HPPGVDLDAVDPRGPLLALDAPRPDVQVLAQQVPPEAEADPRVEHRRGAALDDRRQAVLQALPDAQGHAAASAARTARGARTGPPARAGGDTSQRETRPE